MPDQKRGPSNLAFSLLPLKRVKGPDAKPLMLSDLPPANTTRWACRRKEVVAAVRGGLAARDARVAPHRQPQELYIVGTGTVFFLDTQENAFFLDTQENADEKLLVR